MPSLTLTFLGTGTSQGVPMIGCFCDICTSKDPRDQRTRTSVVVSDEKKNFLIDTTPDLRFQCLRERIHNVDAVLFTHPHTDHIMGFDDLRRFSELRDSEIPIYATFETMIKIKEAFSFVFDTPKPWKGYLRIIPHIIDGSFSLEDFEITPIPLAHGAMTTQGFVFIKNKKKLLSYFTDCQEVTSEAITAATGSEILVLDALRDKFHPTHLNFSRAIQAAQKIQAKKTYFIHFCHDVSHAQKEASLPAGMFLAYDGLKVVLDS